MGRLSPENTGGRWSGGATGPAVGARFRGANRRGARRWSTSVEVTACEPGRRFAFDVTSAGLGVSRWSYEIEPRGAGCTVTESWQDRRGRPMVLLGRLITGVEDRAAFSAQSIEQTLAAVKRVAET
ncbi:MAG: SRPBCC family protein [Actinobacteria bacterium]|nr:SRPBCC family protein [Actinomycetota bacterium]